jgi:uncharacterized protein YbbK (DUF523 family)
MSNPDRRGEAAPILVSACLMGLPTRFDGGHCERDGVVRMARAECLVPICPEQLGGLPTPRLPCQIETGDGEAVLSGLARVRDAAGADVTDQFLRGAEMVARIAEILGAGRAILKEGSPACGIERISREGRDVQGCGVTAALLRRRRVHLEGRE